MKNIKKDKNFYWLVGILEGEASFATSGNYPFIAVRMTDLDIIKRVAKIFQSYNFISRQSKGRYNIRPYQPKWPKSKLQYTVSITGKSAAELIRIIYKHMGKRRKQQIKNILAKYHQIEEILLFKQKRAEKVRKMYSTGKYTQKYIINKFEIKRHNLYEILHNNAWAA